MRTRDGSSCQECKTRKVRCTREWPTCRNCLLHNRTCTRERFPLSWPTKEDPRRLFVASCRGYVQSSDDHRSLHFIHASQEDVMRFIDLGRGYWTSRVIVPPLADGSSIPSGLSFLPQQPSVIENAALISYFYNVTSLALVRIDKRYSIRDVAMRMCLKDDSCSSLALFYSLLHLSAVHRFGDTLQTAQFKGLALGALRKASASANMDGTCVARLVGANIFLCRAAISLHAHNSSDWMLYSLGGKTILSSLAKDDLITSTQEVEARAAYQGLHYHSVIARFTLQHWKAGKRARETRSLIQPGSKVSPLVNEVFQPLHNFGTLSSILRVFDEVLDVLYTVETRGFSERLNNEKVIKLYEALRTDYQEASLVWRGSSSPGFLDSGLSPPLARNTIDPEAKLDSMRNAVCLAGVFIYLDRSLHPRSCRSDEIENLLDNVFAMLKYDLQHTEVRAPRRLTPFTLLLVGAEARDDHERRIMLDIIKQASTEAERWLQIDGQEIPAVGFRSTSMDLVTKLLEKLWVWDDLHESAPGQTADYKMKLDEVMSSFATLPPLV